MRYKEWHFLIVTLYIYTDASKCDSLIFEINQVKGSNISAHSRFNNHSVDLDNASVVLKAGNTLRIMHGVFSAKTNEADNHSKLLPKKVLYSFKLTLKIHFYRFYFFRTFVPHILFIQRFYD